MARPGQVPSRISALCAPGWRRRERLYRAPRGGREKAFRSRGALGDATAGATARRAPGKLAARVLAYLIAGHHAGLADWEATWRVRLGNADSAQELQDALDAQPPQAILDAGDFVPDLKAIPGGKRRLCAVGADAVLLPGGCRLPRHRGAFRRGQARAAQRVFPRSPCTRRSMPGWPRLPVRATPSTPCAPTSCASAAPERL